MKGQKQDCSNCGYTNHYTKKELDDVFPYSRERLKCKGCLPVLSVCGGFV